jgi:dTDP-4-amino-4,6-dideoxygalactose transaminase
MALKKLRHKVKKMAKHAIKNDLPIMDTNEGIVLFHPHIPKNAIKNVSEVLRTRWIGQGPKVDEFEARFKLKFNFSASAVSTGSGTDALHLAYLLAGIGSGDEVLTPLFTCTATNLPLLYIGAKPKFVDVDPTTMNICIRDMQKKISKSTKAIVLVHYGGLPCDMSEINEMADHYGIPVIEDAAHALGAKYDGKYIGDISPYTMFSFQAIKHLTTGDGGMLMLRDRSKLSRAQRLRWFGIDRSDKQRGIWENDIVDLGYKYQMTDLSAAIGLAGLEEYNETIDLRQNLYRRYKSNLKNCRSVTMVDDNNPKKVHAAWMFTILVERRKELQEKLRQSRIESGQTHYRNDRYSIFDDNGHYPNMDAIDDKYLVLPLHTKMSVNDVDLICEVIKNGW